MEEVSGARWHITPSTGHGAFTFVGDEVRLASTIAVATLAVDDVDLTYAPVFLLLAVQGIESGRHWLQLGVEVFWTEAEAVAAKR